MNFPYVFDNSSKKYLCPNCDKKRMVCYYDIKTKQRLPLNYGKCDRITECGYFSYPSFKLYKNEIQEYCYTPPKEESYIDYSLVSGSVRNFKKNNFIQFLKTIFNNDQIKEAISKYCIGTSKLWGGKGATVFWQIDKNENVRHGKIMLYDIETGKRQKNQNGKPFIHSVKNLLKLNDFNLKQCLFGLHLVNESISKTVALVESEKTAIIMSIYKPEYLWLATGCESGFKYDYLKDIKNYKIIAFPDKSEYNKWLDKSLALNDIGFNISVSDYVENLDCVKGTDLADVFLKQVKEREEGFKGYSSKSESKNETKIIKSNTDLTVSKLIKTNPNLIELITCFDLVDVNGNNIVF
ncbi:DUF6371 domain-containing protein [Olleya sp. Hel_I_94]|uniref:DUF6371 domain-containing protein n=1 Tax=Olleya sp. Hel_I_94 TaxID=1250001 RepID=UPI0011A140FE|nr:DUF6371 domain-containing protein [Olleya sp. Hel_I_94]TVZ49881.1 hypothetical protein JM82_0320 [Olleya sp. Hel_I_94]